MRLLHSLIAAALSGTLLAQAPTPLPKVIQNNGRFALLVEGKPFLMLGAQINNSSAWPEMLPEVWPTIEKIHANTVEAPIYWEQWEPTPGHFDPSVLRALLAGAREHHVHLVLLWFGTWKNGSGHYIPERFKLDEARVPHVTNREGRKVDSLSPHSQYILDADRTAFTALLRELKLSDPQHTVLMVQVENETGSYGSVRDFSPAANQLFAGEVPAALVQALHKQPGTWSDVFGADADEFFHAYSIAHFVNEVAAAGKAVNPLPMYVNVALRDPFHPGRPGSYDTGGPTDNVLDIWKAATPAIDIIAPDIYNATYPFYSRILDIYRRPDNALFVPETGNTSAFAHFFFLALGRGAIGFSPFGLDSTGSGNYPIGVPRITDDALAPLALDYSLLQPISREIARLNLEGKVQGISENPDEHSSTLDFGAWKAFVGFGLPGFGSQGNTGAKGNTPPEGGAIVAQLGPAEFLVTGVHTRIDFLAADPARQRQFLRVEEGSYIKGVWHMTRIWNGDQTDYGLNFTSLPQVLRVTLATY